MRAGNAWVLAAVLALLGSGCRREAPESRVSPAGPGEAAEDASAMVVELFMENSALKAQVEALSGQVERLLHQLAEAREASDRVRVETGRPATAPQAGPVEVLVDDLTRVRVLEVNRDMQVAVVSGGRQAGMKPGMRFHVLRGERVVGRIRLTDVRETIAGGLIEKMEQEGFPESGDRVILSSKQDG
ncbi:MAG TPA: hypothetical protein PKE26_06940 [Kiritimatiellia bacterium]|nr:hypothetical protein [Kiritimatiellia bacterium]HMO98826.1 hypothetical protein [Kiritimatiellia bacterium]HMP96226.1 hypothetical protein [Kiritimatiellia bacterium]